MKNKKTYSIILALLVCMLFTQTAWAEVHNDEKYTVKTNETKGWPQGADTYSETAVLMDAKTGEVLFDKGKDETRYPASITKIMTTLLALEHCKLDEQVTFTETGLARMAEGSNINMQVGEIMTMEQCLYAVMIRSANEVAAQVAEHVAGSQEEFARMMNERAQELGCTNTHFNNPSGLPDENHWTTANDMALIFREALKNEEFVKIIGTLEYTIPPTNLNPEARTVSSHHAMIVPTAPEYYEGCIGGKTGVTDLSQNTLVTAAERDGIRLIAVVMRADPGQVCADTKALFDYGFGNFEKLAVQGGELLVPKGVTENDLTETSVDIEDGVFRTYTYNDYTVGTVTVSQEELDAMEKAEQAENEEQQAVTKEPVPETEGVPEKQDESVSGTYRTIIIVLGVLIAAAVLLIIIKAATRKKKRKRRKKR
ncbi:D-alanyl-D-alanine carboxypeptidase [Ruminococcus sp. OA3]|uniref:D-alanyl-D-alanine carboxypeptidase family protein n=1 Tax=Ruminococcus sp. OA3 TaxID=2914164 RepID=UPI001F065F00|nr:D-alanyl-D-alanine carboxypeptidase family protein [Ruminococcus sp. OA3]MCH1982173.1 D-alanyl-D-alanine carboxypeptidase [Ruminococcus sp. OA3]